MRATMIKVLAKRAVVITAFAALAFQAAAGQSSKPSAAGAADDAAKLNTSEVAKTLKVAAEALGLARWSGVGGQRLPEVDVINTMEIWGSGTTYGLSQASKPGEPGPAFKTEYHATLGYNPPAMRVELTRTSSGAPSQGGAAPQQTIEVVRDKYAWDESEIGGGLVPGKGTATPAMAAVDNRLLQLWILPYGVIKAALAAGDKTKVSTEKGTTVITFPLSEQLANVMVKATLDAQNEVAKVETRSENPALSDLNTETEYTDYADHGEIATDVKSPGHIVRKRSGHPVLDIRVKMLDANNPYLVFPVPENIKKVAAH
ncbi:MAG TPA: hypothetical protein VN976_18600 [Verrucomicrobiae bacterium]|nr:hypothetical protein [Verrucomicrobiae bacterium]